MSSHLSLIFHGPRLTPARPRLFLCSSRCYYSFRDGSPAPSTMTGQANEPQCPSMAASTTTCYSGSGSYTCQNPVRMDNGEVTCDNMMRRRGINTDPGEFCLLSSVVRKDDR